MDLLLLPTEGLLPLHSGVLPPLVKVLSPLMQNLPAAGEGPAAVTRVASRLRVTEVALAGPSGGETVAAEARARPFAEVGLARFEAIASWRACADQQTTMITNSCRMQALPQT